MDHSDALRLRATEKYLLNELDLGQRDQFEEHLFDCPECALDLRAAAAFVEQAKNVLSEPDSTGPVSVRVPARQGWLAWLRPAFAAPALAVLLAVVGYQNLVALPQLHRQANAPQVLASVSLIDVRSRGTAVKMVRVPKGEPFLLFVDVPVRQQLASYVAEFHDPAGSIQWSLPVSADAVKDTLSIRVPGLQGEGGKYELVVRGLGASGTGTEVARYPFELQFQ